MDCRKLQWFRIALEPLSEEYFYTSSSINSYINWGLLGIARCVGKNDGKGVDEIYNLPLESLLKIEGGK